MPDVPIVDLRIPNDETVIPRVRIDSYLQAEYRQAFVAYGGWGEFPPVTVDQDYLVLDGITRVLAAESAGLLKAKVSIVNCDDRERFLIVARSNATHGKRWETKDLVVLSNLAERFKVSSEDLAGALRVPISKIERIPIATVTRAVVGGGEERERVYVKRSLRSALEGRVITEREAELIEGLTTPNTAELILQDFLRLADLDALAPLNLESIRTVQRAKEAIEEWLERDKHLLEPALA